MPDRKKKPSPQTKRLEEYVYRRPLAAKELIPAIGIGVAAGLAAFYVTRLFIQRTPLLPEKQRAARLPASSRVAG
ncbi:MAG: hypothetical protein V4550_11265 [Gemmatimonadota bacterium]